MNLLKDLYSGKIYPFENIVPTDKEYRPTSEKAGELRDYFQENHHQKIKENSDNGSSIPMKSIVWNALQISLTVFGWELCFFLTY